MGPLLRKERLEQLIREELDLLFDGEISDRRLEGTRITRVVLSPEGARANTWFVAPPGVDDLDLERALSGARGFLRARLCDALELKRTPELRFFRDSGASNPEEP